MSAAAFIRSASRARVAPFARRAFVQKPVFQRAAFSAGPSRLAGADVDAHDPHHEESFEDFTARYEKEFENVQDVFELQRNLNNAFAYDLVPSPSVVIAALRAARRVNDFPTAVRIFEGINAKVENKSQYDEYLTELQGIREELGVVLKEDLFPTSS
ncbi:hypothetical protein WHR41_01553 [Cladosporium halotolerans]|uniref:Cytochrome c oxidase subunit 6, mitochondrial n=1 Tax=Cladosporium halotolerans TaxID=1052096 RepID=A0AB34KZR6_9PEZI